jgi:hypothetical protein
MRMPPFTPATWNDAGLLREYAAAHFGLGLEYGTSFRQFERAIHIARRLCKLVGGTVDRHMTIMARDALARYTPPEASPVRLRRAS